MGGLGEVVVDREVLERFKRRALAAYPREIIEQIVGRVVGAQARIFAFRDLEFQATRNRVFMDDDANPMVEGGDESGFEILGTIHTHPQDTVEPSPTDWRSMSEDSELLMGVCAIRKTERRRFVTIAFFGTERNQLQLTISEGNHSSRKRRAAGAKG